jgi:CheY-like chemotaxis protein
MQHRPPARFGSARAGRLSTQAALGVFSLRTGSAETYPIYQGILGCLAEAGGLSASISVAGTLGRLSQEEAPTSGLSMSAAYATARPRCLVLAENASLRLLVRMILSLEGWEAVEQEDSAFQAVVADLDCFVWPGERVSRVVRQAMLAGLPVLALTGQDLNPQECAAIGSPPLLMKPFELASFIQVLHNWRLRLESRVA